tara:strand:+ start:5141 stop:5350 length:210 start_codon:yes stop_codon:yes gene_type:complete
MKTYDLFIEEDGCTWLTGEIIRESDPLGQGNTRWEVNWESGSFLFYGGKNQLKAILRTMKPNFIIGGER